MEVSKARFCKPSENKKTNGCFTDIMVFFCSGIPPQGTTELIPIYYELKFVYLTATGCPPLTIKCKRKPIRKLIGFFILWRCQKLAFVSLRKIKKLMAVLQTLWFSFAQVSLLGTAELIPISPQQ